MRDEDILSALRVAAKADAAAIDPALERLSRGEATPEERARLEAEAERSEEAAALLEAFRPLDPLARARMRQAVRRTRGPRRGAALVAGLLAVACAVAIIVARPSAPPLPAYALEMSAGDRLERGSEGAKATVVSTGFAPRPGRPPRRVRRSGRSSANRRFRGGDASPPARGLKRRRRAAKDGSRSSRQAPPARSSSDRGGARP